MERVILHCDLNNFYASVECLKNPEYANVPLVVTGDPEKRSGIVLAKNQLAKKANIKTGDIFWQAKQKCPNLIAIKANHADYAKASKQVKQIYLRYTNKVESFGADECWLDVTQSQKLFGNGKTIADTLRKIVKEETGLTISVGVSFSKMFAKLGSDFKKPDATTEITKQNYKQLVWPLNAQELIFIGRRRIVELNKLNIYTIGDLAQADEKILIKHFGINGPYLKQIANGIESDEVCDCDDVRQIKSVGNGTTTAIDISSFEQAKQVIYFLCDSVSKRLRDLSLECMCISLDIRASDLKWISRSKTIDKSTNNDGEIANTVLRLLKQNWNFDTNINKIRALRVACSHLVTNKQNYQLNIFQKSDNNEKLKKLDQNLDKIRTKYGYSSVRRGLLLNNTIIKTDAIEDFF